MIKFYEMLQDDGEKGYFFTDSKECTFPQAKRIALTEFLTASGYPTNIARDENLSMSEFETLLNEYAFAFLRTSKDTSGEQVDE